MNNNYMSSFSLSSIAVAISTFATSAMISTQPDIPTELDNEINKHNDIMRRIKQQEELLDRKGIVNIKEFSGWFE